MDGNDQTHAIQIENDTITNTTLPTYPNHSNKTMEDMDKSLAPSEDPTVSTSLQDSPPSSKPLGTSNTNDAPNVLIPIDDILDLASKKVDDEFIKRIRHGHKKKNTAKKNGGFLFSHRTNGNVPHTMDHNQSHPSNIPGSIPSALTDSSVTGAAVEQNSSHDDSKKKPKSLQKALKDRKKRHRLSKFYKKQNNFIDELLAPIGMDENEADAEAQRLVKLKIAIYGSFVANIILFCLQLYAAISSGSLSLFATMADAFMDLGSNLVLIIANHAASKKNLEKYPTGKRKFETAGIIVFSCIMGALSVELIVRFLILS